MVKSGQDVDHLIKSWHDMFRLGGLVATLPWLVHPIISFPLLRQYLMPQPGHKSGSGHIMSVSMIVPDEIQPVEHANSPTRSFF